MLRFCSKATSHCRFNRFIYFCIAFVLTATSSVRAEKNVAWDVHAENPCSEYNLEIQWRYEGTDDQLKQKISHWFDCANSTDSLSRSGAILTADRVIPHARKALDYVVRGTRDADPDVRHAAILEFRLPGRDYAPAAYDEIVAALRDSRWQTQHDAAIALGNIGKSKDFFDSGVMSGAARSYPLEFAPLWSQRHLRDLRDRAIAEIRRAKKRESGVGPEIAAIAAIYANLNDPDAVRILARELRQPDPMRFQISEALIVGGTRTISVPSDLATLANGTDSDLRWYAMRILTEAPRRAALARMPKPASKDIVNPKPAFSAPLRKSYPCKATIRNALDAIDRKAWGTVRAECDQSGWVKTIRPAKESAIVKHCVEFVRGNTRVFGLKSTELLQYNSTMFRQYYKGVPLGGGFVQCGSPLNPASMWIAASIEDSHSWKINPNPKISSSTAVVITNKLWRGMKPVGPPKVTDVTLEISTWPRPPLLVWYIWGSGGNQTDWFGASCFLDANTGKPTRDGCRVNNRVGTSDGSKPRTPLFQRLSRWLRELGRPRLPTGVAGFHLGQGYFAVNLNAALHLRKYVEGTNVGYSDLEWRFFVPILSFLSKYSSISVTLSTDQAGDNPLWSEKAKEINACTDSDSGSLLNSSLVTGLPAGPGIYTTQGLGAKFWSDGGTLIRATDQCITFFALPKGGSMRFTVIGGGDDLYFVGGSTVSNRTYLRNRGSF